MTILSIKRDFNLFPNLVGITTSSDLTAITTVGYLSTQATVIAELNNGEFQWEPEDLVLIYYATEQIGFFVHDVDNDTFVALAPNGGVSSTLASAHILVGNGANVATSVNLSGDATISNTGAMTIASSAVTTAKINDNAVTFGKLAVDVAQTVTVSLTANQIKALYDTPVQLVAAGGANTLIIIESILWDIAYSAANFTAGGLIAAQYGSTVHGLGPVASGTIAAATLNGVGASGYLSQGVAALNIAATAENTAVYLSNQTANFATGASTATLYIVYRLVTPA